jgi:hypothetical protein
MEFDGEPVRGLPERLPAGEAILWQGSPAWRSLARHLFHVRLVVLYFIVMMVWRFAASRADGMTEGEALIAAVLLIPVLLAALAILALLAWAISRTTVYTVTNRRVVMRFGVALPMSVNLPFAIIEAADVKRYGDGTGDIALSLKRSQRFSYLMGWPHVRPSRLLRPQPMLRSIPDLETAIDRLAKALKAAQPPATAKAPDAEAAAPEAAAARSPAWVNAA